MTKTPPHAGDDELPEGPLRRVAAAFTEQELERIDTWGFERRIRDRTTVLRQLVQRALHASQPQTTADA